MKTAPIPAIVKEAIGLAERLSAQTSFRLIGSCAIWYLCTPKHSWLQSVGRMPKDIDAVILRTHVPALARLLSAEGWMDDVEIRTWSEGERLRYLNSTSQTVLDICVDRLRFCQVLDVRNVIMECPITLPVTEVFLSKVQISSKTESDLIDLTALLNSFGSSSRTFGFDAARLRRLMADSWRWQYAFENAASELLTWVRTTPALNPTCAERTLTNYRRLLAIAQVGRHRWSWHRERLIAKLTGHIADEVEVPEL